MALLRPSGRRKRRSRYSAWLVVPVLLLSGGTGLSAQTAPSKEYQVKAVFLFHFAQFVDWPANAFADAQSPLVIGVLGEDPFGSYLDETVRGETVNGHPLAVQHYGRVEEINNCHVLFVSRSETARLDQVLAGIKERSILTTADFDGFSSRGGMIRFVTENNKTRLRINLEAAKAAHLTISSKLLRLAQIVTTEGG